VVAAHARLSHAQSEHQRAARLWDERAIAQRELDERVSAARTAEADLRAAQAALQASKLQLSYTQVRAPIAGRIGRIEITPGNLVAAGPGAPVLATLVSVSPIYASFDAAEGPGSAARTAKGAVPVELGTAGANGTPIKGRLQLVDNQVDARSGTLRLRAVFDNADGSLMPGQFARIRLGQPSTRQALLVSERAIGTDQDKRFVMVVAPDNTAQYREVALGATVDGLRVVTKGLKEGERIVVNGLQRVRPGALVAPQVVPMDARTNGTPTRVAAR
jgi:multidrug efflux system membrane fusion protein